MTPEEAGFGLNQFNLRDTILKETCPSDPVCDQRTLRSPFRTLDGSCNNIKRSFWGKSRTQFQRALVPAYFDGNILLTTYNYKDVGRRANVIIFSNFFLYIGVWLPRRAENGGELPR